MGALPGHTHGLRGAKRDSCGTGAGSGQRAKGEGMRCKSGSVLGRGRGETLRTGTARPVNLRASTHWVSCRCTGGNPCLEGDRAGGWVLSSHRRACVPNAADARRSAPAAVTVLVVIGAWYPICGALHLRKCAAPTKSAKKTKGQERAGGGERGGGVRTVRQGMRVQGNAGGLAAGRRLLTEEFRARGRRSPGVAMPQTCWKLVRGLARRFFFFGGEKAS